MNETDYTETLRTAMLRDQSTVRWSVQLAIHFDDQGTIMRLGYPNQVPIARGVVSECRRNGAFHDEFFSRVVTALKRSLSSSLPPGMCLWCDDDDVDTNNIISNDCQVFLDQNSINIDPATVACDNAQCREGATALLARIRDQG